MRFELTTPTLARLCSTPELRPRPWVTPAGPGLRGGHIAEPWGQSKGRFRTAFASPATGHSPGGNATGARPSFSGSFSGRRLTCGGAPGR